jgi:hypothetical protein
MLSSRSCLQPYQHASYATSTALTLPRWHNDDKLEAIKGVSATDLRAFIVTELLSAVYIRCLGMLSFDHHRYLK